MDSREIEGAAGCDADLEARLYAEIHYSNETYPDHIPNPIPPRNNQDAFINPLNNIPPPMPAPYPTLLPQYNNHGIAHTYPVHHNQWAVDTRPNRNPNNPIMYPTNRQPLELNTNYNNPPLHHPAMNYQPNNGMFSKRPRALLDNVIHPQYHYPNYQNTSMPPPSTRYNNNRGRGRNTYSSNIQIPFSANVDPRNARYERQVTNRREKRCETVTRSKSGPTATATTSKDTTKNNSKNNSSNNEPNESTSSQSTINTETNPTNSDNAIENSSCPPEIHSDSTSKYNVTAKTNQQPQIKRTDDKNSIEVSSDSDESIFEVPVPPKPAPLLINLNDSGEELSSSDDDDDDDEQSPVIMGKKSCELSQPPPPGTDDIPDLSLQIVPTILPSLSQSDELSRDNSTNETPTEIINEELSNDIDTMSNNIIINCTQVATGVTTLADIKRMRESIQVTSNNNLVSDDDSMTESEAMKWGQIEGQMTSNKSGDNILNQLQTQNSTNSIDNSTIVDNSRMERADESTSRLVDEVIDSGGNTLNLERGVSRKRLRSLNSPTVSGEKLNDNGNKRRKSTREMSFEEYVFQPMPKPLEEFYNEPRGGATLMDVHKIQSRMPNNPNCWAILDADKGINLRSREKRKICSVCQRTGHNRDKCPTGRPVPRCHMCGETGHYEPRCPHSMCLTCGTKYSSYRKTCESCRNVQCTTCKSQGHTNENCPDLWRRYHQTTPPIAGVNSPRDKGTHKSSSSSSSTSSKTRHTSHNNDKKYPRHKSERKKSPTRLSKSKLSHDRHSINDENKLSNRFNRKKSPTHSPKSKSYKDKRLINDNNKSSNRSNRKKSRTRSPQYKSSNRSDKKKSPPRSSKSKSSNDHSIIIKINNQSNKTYDKKSPIKSEFNENKIEPVKIKNEKESIASFTSSSLSTSSATSLPLNGHIFYHWKCPSLWPDNLKSNLTRLNDIEGSMFDGLIAGTVFPAFITELDEICPFELIIGYHDGFAQMLLKTYSDEVLELLKKLLIMWFIRDDDDKWLMIGGANLPINRHKLLHILNERIIIARSKWSTSDLNIMYDHMNKLETRKNIIADIYKSYPDVKPPDVQLSLEKVQATTYDLKWRIVLCLYYCGWIQGGNKIIDDFHTMLIEIERNTNYIEIPVPIYLNFLIFCNEVFIPHMSQHIIDGANACIKSTDKQKRYEKKVWSAFNKNKLIMQTLNKLMFQYEICKQHKNVNNRKLIETFDKVKSIMNECPDNETYIKSLESYRELFVDGGSIQQLTVIVGYFSSLLRKKLQLSEVWRKKKVQKIRQELEEMRHLHKTSGTSVIVPTDPFKILKPLNELSCSNCTKTGHHSTNCKKSRWSQHYQSPRYVSSYIKGPLYPQDDILIDDYDTNTIIDLVHDDDDDNDEDDYNDNDISIQPIDNRNKILFYEYSTVPINIMQYWPKKTIRYKKLPILFEDKKNFFKQQFPSESKCQFGVIIYKLPNYYEIIIKTPCNDTLIIFEKLILQLFDEKRKIKIKNSQQLPWNKSELLSFLMIGLSHIVDKTKPKSLRHAAAIASMENQLKSKKRGPIHRNMINKNLAEAKCNLLMACYNYGLISNSAKILYELQVFIKRLAALSIPDNNYPVSPEFYMTAVWFKFELFTCYITREITRAALKAQKKFKQELASKKRGKNINGIETLVAIITESTLNKLENEILSSPPVHYTHKREVQMFPAPSTKSMNNKNNKNSSQSSTGQFNTWWTCNANTLHDFGHKSNEIIFLNTSNHVASTTNNHDKHSNENSISKNNNRTLKVSTSTTVVDKNIKNTTNHPDTIQLETPFNFPKPILKHIIGNKGIVKYAKTAVAYARKNNLTSMITQLEHFVERAKSGSIRKKEMFALWKKMRATVSPDVKKKKIMTPTQRRRLRKNEMKKQIDK